MAATEKQIEAMKVLKLRMKLQELQEQKMKENPEMSQPEALKKTKEMHSN